MAGYETLRMRRLRGRRRFPRQTAAHRFKRHLAQLLARHEEPIAPDVIYGETLVALLPPLLSDLQPTRRIA